jgi:hypothetical protein
MTQNSEPVPIYPSGMCFNRVSYPSEPKRHFNTLPVHGSLLPLLILSVQFTMSLSRYYIACQLKAFEDPTFAHMQIKTLISESCQAR